jgi:hypothetical protein
MLPAANEKDLREVPEAVRGHVRFTFVSTMDEVLGHMLLVGTGERMADGGWRMADTGTRLADEPPLPADF